MGAFGGGVVGGLTVHGGAGGEERSDAFDPAALDDERKSGKVVASASFEFVD